MPAIQRNTSYVENASSRRLRVLLVVLPLVVTGYMLTSGDSGLARIWQQSERIDVLKRDIARLEKENASLSEETRLLKDDPKTIERIARERYGMVKDNESIYMVYPSPPAKVPR
jgi:cell division protein FtsB